MAEGADRRAVGDRTPGPKNDIRLDRHVAAELGIVREPHRLGRDQRHAVGHRALATRRLPAPLAERHLGAAVDAGDLRRLGFDHDRAATVGQRQRDDIGQIIFARRIVVADALEQRPQVRRAHRDQPGIAQRHGAFVGARILVFDHLGDPPVGIGDDPAIGGGIRRAEAEHRRPRASPAPSSPATIRASSRPDERYVAETDQHVAIEPGQRRLRLQRGMGRAELLRLHRDSTPSGATAASTCSRTAPTTMTVRSRPARATLSSRCSSIGRPAIGCSTLCRSDFIRVPLPAARMIAAMAVVSSSPIALATKALPFP